MNTDESPEEIQAFNNGYQDAIEGKATNPYSPDTDYDLYRAWMGGQ